MRYPALALAALILASCSSEAPVERESASQTTENSEAQEQQEMANAAADAALNAGSQSPYDAARGESQMVTIYVEGQSEQIEAQTINIQALRDEARKSVVSTGATCAAVERFQQLRQNGRDLDIFKVTCAGGGEHQMTILNDRVFVKPWTGRIFETQ